MHGRTSLSPQVFSWSCWAINNRYVIINTIPVLQVIPLHGFFCKHPLAETGYDFLTFYLVSAWLKGTADIEPQRGLWNSHPVGSSCFTKTALKWWGGVAWPTAASKTGFRPAGDIQNPSPSTKSISYKISLINFVLSSGSPLLLNPLVRGESVHVTVWRHTWPVSPYLTMYGNCIAEDIKRCLHLLGNFWVTFARSLCRCPRELKKGWFIGGRAFRWRVFLVKFDKFNT